MMFRFAWPLVNMVSWLSLTMGMFLYSSISLHGYFHEVPQWYNRFLFSARLDESVWWTHSLYILAQEVGTKHDMLLLLLMVAFVCLVGTLGLVTLLFGYHLTEKLVGEWRNGCLEDWQYITFGLTGVAIGCVVIGFLFYVHGPMWAGSGYGLWSGF